MSMFKWKRKAESSFTEHVQKWIESSADDQNENLSDSEVDCVTWVKRKKTLCLEDVATKVERLKNEGILFAELEKYSESIERFKTAIELQPNDGRLHEMLSQVFLMRGEDFLAIQAAERAVKCCPDWAEAYQTLARAQLNFGELNLAVESFRFANSIDNTNEEIEQELQSALLLQAHSSRLHDTNGSSSERNLINFQHGIDETTKYAATFILARITYCKVHPLTTFSDGMQCCTTFCTIVQILKNFTVRVIIRRFTNLAKVEQKKLIDRVQHSVALSWKVRDLNIFITETFEDALAQVVNLSRKFCNDPLFGLPIVVKDCFSTKGVRTTLGSKALENYKPNFTATVVEKLLQRGCVLLGKTNMDEFCMGTSGTNSYFGPVKNPWTFEVWRGKFDKEHNLENDWYITGGSSGGSAAAVACGISEIALGSDTGGSCRNPAAYCGVVGFKPTYGLLSRHGLVPLINSLDCVGILAKRVKNVSLALDAMAGLDWKDSTMEFYTPYLSADVVKYWKLISSILEREGGCKLVELSLPHTRFSNVCYHILGCSEIASNMSRYDGMEYGYRSNDEISFPSMLTRSRQESLNDVVRQRILAGNFFLLKNNYDKFYVKSLQIRRLIYEDYLRVFNDQTVDVLLTPATSSDAPLYSQLKKDHYNCIQERRDDYFTLPANLAGLPALVLPVGLSGQNLPVGLQLIGKHFVRYQYEEERNPVKFSVNYLAQYCISLIVFREFSTNSLLECFLTAMPKLNAETVRYIESDDLRLLLGTELGMRKYEYVPQFLIVYFAKLKHDIGFRLSSLGYDCLALHALFKGEILTAIGNQIGTGKESDVMVAKDKSDRRVILKMHRLGRTSFRKIRECRNYHKGRCHMSWLYLSRLSAMAEYQFMKALHERNFPVPIPLGWNRHCVVMSHIDGVPLNHVHELKNPTKFCNKLLDFIVMLAKYGLIHGDFNPCNVMVTRNEEPVVIDFPQMMSTSHPEAEKWTFPDQYFERDMFCILDYFQKKFSYHIDEVPTLDGIQKIEQVDAQLKAHGYTATSDSEDDNVEQSELDPPCEMEDFILEMNCSQEKLNVGNRSEDIEKLNLTNNHRLDSAFELLEINDDKIDENCEDGIESVNVMSNEEVVKRLRRCRAKKYEKLRLKACKGKKQKGKN
ncbi:Glutamyl-tRNA(Gln) amidotransferase subunit A, mitochondrial [Trichinella nativa]|uniref:Glutamyl-tRNA(Gln) amidotransferase subunit A, mitochondrial n=1 Tax=Trichinella nativa TaxID=6335 RepID=A0A0V1LBL6_9BILA|nr:Glutamyl-tRNA(Gln) amidotransferase subunit A, mitochondrial [Trichinella nativa]